MNVDDERLLTGPVSEENTQMVAAKKPADNRTTFPPLWALHIKIIIQSKEK